MLQGPDQERPERRGGHCVPERRPGCRVQFPVDDLRHQVVGQLHEIVVSGRPIERGHSRHVRRTSSRCSSRTVGREPAVWQKRASRPTAGAWRGRFGGASGASGSSDAVKRVEWREAAGVAASDGEKQSGTGFSAAGRREGNRPMTCRVVVLAAVVAAALAPAADRLPVRVTFTAESVEHRLALADLDPQLPTDWSAFDFLVLEFKASSSQRFDLGLETAQGRIAKRIGPLAGAWVRAAIPLRFYRQPAGSAGDLAATFNQPRGSFWINIHSDAVGPTTGVRALWVAMPNPVGSPTLEIRAIALAKADPGDAVLEGKPVVDEFGQYTHAAWPGKARSTRGSPAGLGRGGQGTRESSRRSLPVRRLPGDPGEGDRLLPRRADRRPLVVRRSRRAPVPLHRRQRRGDHLGHARAGAGGPVRRTPAGPARDGGPKRVVLHLESPAALRRRLAAEMGRGGGAPACRVGLQLDPLLGAARRPAGLRGAARALRADAAMAAGPGDHGDARRLRGGLREARGRGGRQPARPAQRRPLDDRLLHRQRAVVARPGATVRRSAPRRPAGRHAEAGPGAPRRRRHAGAPQVVRGRGLRALPGDDQRRRAPARAQPPEPRHPVRRRPARRRYSAPRAGSTCSA